MQADPAFQANHPASGKYHSARFPPVKTLLAKLSLAATVMLAPLALHAQTDNTVYGRTTVAFNQAFTQQLSSFGVTITDLNGVALPNGTLTLNTLEGVLDLQTAFGDVFFAGGYQVTAQGQTVRVQNLEFSIVNATTAYISGDFVVNGSFVSRQPIFVVNRNPVGTVYTLPLVPQNGTLTLNGFSLGLSPYFVTLINGAIGQPALNAGTQIGTSNVFAVVIPPTGS